MVVGVVVEAVGASEGDESHPATMPSRPSAKIDSSLVSLMDVPFGVLVNDDIIVHSICMDVKSPDNKKTEKQQRVDRKSIEPDARPENAKISSILVNVLKPDPCHLAIVFV
jgi:hypothetical protein